MDLQWSWLAIPGIADLVVGWTLAILVYRAQPRNPQNRALAFMLALGSSYYFAIFPARLLLGEFRAVRATYVTAIALGHFFLPAYLGFLATVNVRLVRFLRRRAVQAVVWGTSIIAFAATLANPELFFGTATFHDNLGTWTFAETTLRSWLNLFPLAVASLLGLAAAIQSLRAARSSASRGRARSYVAAFGARDVATLGLLVYYLFFWDSDVVADAQLGFFAFPMTEIIFAVLLAYGILKVHLFDIDLRIKRGFARGILTTVFLATVLIVGQLVQNATTTTFGVVGGAVVAGFLLLLIRPLDRAANRLADAAMPHVRDTPGYAAFRKFEVYKAAVEELSVGGVSAKERRALDALRTKLGIAAADAKAMERDATKAGAT